MKSLEKISNTNIDSRLFSRLLKIYEQKGKKEYYEDVFKDFSQKYKVYTTQSNIFYLFKILDFKFSDTKISKWSKRDYVENNKEEVFANNIKRALKYIEKSKNLESLYSADVLDINNILSKRLYHGDIFNLKKEYRQGSSIISARSMLTDLLAVFTKLLNNREYEGLYTTILFYNDFLNLELFNNNNKLIALLLVYKIILHMFSCFEYVSFFKILYKNINKLEEAIVAAKFNWDMGYSNCSILYETFIFIIEEAYIEMFKISNMYKFDTQINKSDNIEASILQGEQVFSKSDIRKKYPNCSLSTIDRVLAKLRDSNKIRPIGIGRSAKWHLVENNEYIQGDIFGEVDFDK